jgi:hypothetical protein
LTFTLVGIFGGLVMLIAIVYVPMLYGKEDNEKSRSPIRLGIRPGEDAIA